MPPASLRMARGRRQEEANPGPVMFSDRREAGARLGEALSRLAGLDVVVLGIPRGGVVVAALSIRTTSNWAPTAN